VLLTVTSVTDADVHLSRYINLGSAGFVFLFQIPCCHIWLMIGVLLV